MWQYAESVCKNERSDRTPLTDQDISSNKIDDLVNEINQKLSGEDIDPKIRSKIKRASKSWREQLERNEANAELIGDRGSLSKTDKNAIFMKMKEDHMCNDQLKTAYNTQISSEDGIITNYTMHQTPTDTTIHKEHTEEFCSMYGHYPKESIADDGHGSEENYEYAQSKEITAYIKSTIFIRSKKKLEERPFQ